MKNLMFLIIAVSLGLTSCGIFKKTNKAGNFLPEGFENLELGMSEAKVKSLRPGLQQESTEYDFRKVYVEKNPTVNIPQAVYYFDTDNDHPFYEIILEYKDMESRDIAAELLLGDPNTGGEWYFEKGTPYPIKAWKFKNKLVVTSLIPQTEWAEEAARDKEDY
ncbi:MAG: hypothetical protein R2769_01680 [Saprospiraceae bacterium]